MWGLIMPPTLNETRLLDAMHGCGASTNPDVATALILLAEKIRANMKKELDSRFFKPMPIWGHW